MQGQNQQLQPIHVQAFEGLRELERIRDTPVYAYSWQKEWNVLWLRPRVCPNNLNVTVLKEAQFQNVGDYPKRHRYRRTDSNEEGNVQNGANPNGPFFKSIGDFLEYSRTESREFESRHRISCSGKRGNEDVKILFQEALETHYSPLALDDFPCWNNELLGFDNPLKLIQTVEGPLSLKAPVLHAGPCGHIHPFKVEPHSLPRVDLVDEGSVAWVIIHPDSMERFLENVCRIFEVPTTRRHCFMKNLHFSATLDQLEAWGLKCAVILQEKGDYLFTFPGSVKVGVNTAFSLISSMNFMTLRREEISKVLQEENRCCCFTEKDFLPRHGIWIPEIPLQLEQTVWHWMYSSVVKTSKDDHAEIIRQTTIEQTIGNSKDIFSHPSNQCPNGIVRTKCDADEFPAEEVPVLTPLLPAVGTPSNPAISIRNGPSAPALCCQMAFIPEHTFNQHNIPQQAFPAETENLTNSTYHDSKDDFSSRIMQEINNCIEWAESSMANDGQNPQENFDTISSTQLNSILDMPPLLPGHGPVHEDSSASIIENSSTDSSFSPTNRFESTNIPPGKEDVTCKICGQSLSTKPHLQRHIFLKHSKKDISVKCPICDKKFANRLSLQKHLKVSDKPISRKANLCRGASKKVEEDKRFRCPICSELFVQRSGFNRHMRNKHAKN